MAANEQRLSIVSQYSMPNVKSSKTSTDAILLDVLPYIARTLGLQGLACLAASNQQFKQACLELVEQNSHHLLLDVLPPLSPERGLAQAATVRLPPPPPAAAAATDQRLQPVLWLSRVAPGMATSGLSAVDVLQRLVHLPHVPLQHAKQLVADGVRIPNAQLMAAANSMVAGVEVWVQAQRELEVTSDIPAAAVAICCGKPWVSVHSAVRRQLFLHCYGTFFY
jgi:hypothetical protein